MTKGTLIIGSGEKGENLIRRVKERVPENEIRKYLSITKSLNKDFFMEEDLYSEKRTLFNEESFKDFLKSFFKSILEKGKDHISFRYLLLFSLDENPFLSIEISNLIRSFHEEIELFPFEIEMFSILPSINSEKEKKSNCYKYLKKIDFLSSTKIPPFDFLWIINPDLISFMPEELLNFLADTVAEYLLTDVYRDFHTQAKMNIFKDKFHGKNTRYSSMGIYHLLFPREKWIFFLSLKLSRDILLLESLSPFPPTPEVAKGMSERFSYFLEETDIQNLLNLSISQKRIEEIIPTLNRVIEESESLDEKETLEIFYTNLDFIIEKKWERIYKEQKFQKYFNSFMTEIVRKMEEIMDKEPHGPFVSSSFMNFLMGRDDILRKILKNLELLKEELPKPLNIPFYLFGWRKGGPSETLIALFLVLSEEIRNTLRLHGLPFGIVTQWKELWEEIEKVKKNSKVFDLLGNDKDYFIELTDIADKVKKALDMPYNNTLSPDDIKQFMNILERRDKKRLEEPLKELKSVDKELREIKSKIKSLGWRIILPSNWKYLSQKREITRKRKSKYEGFMGVVNVFLEKRTKFLPCIYLLLLNEAIEKEIKPYEREVNDFSQALLSKVKSIEKIMDQIIFEENQFTYQIAKKVDEDISALYYTTFTPKDLPEMLLKFFDFLSSPPKISLFYKESERSKFLNGLEMFTLANFEWLRSWNAERVLFHLKRVETALNVLQSSCKPHLGLKDYPEDKGRNCLYIGIENIEKTKLNRSPYNECLNVNHQFFSTSDPQIISGLKIAHGFPLFVIDGMKHLYQCYKELGLEETSEEEIFPENWIK